MAVFVVKRDWAYPQLRVSEHIVTGRSVSRWQKIERNLTYYIEKSFRKSGSKII
jgi:hypothetical protein